MRIVALLLAFFAFADAAQAQVFSGPTERRFSVRDYDRVRVDGGLSVKLVTGLPPYAIARGHAVDLDGLTLTVNGRTLVVRQSAANAKRPINQAQPVTIEIGTREVSEVWVNGSGSLHLDRAGGLKFGASVQGSGSLVIDTVEADNFELLLAGAASARMAGTVEEGTFVVRGLSILQAPRLGVEQLTLGIDGPGTAELGPVEIAEIDMVGAGSATLGGDPACTTRLLGSPSLSGCRIAR